MTNYNKIDEKLNNIIKSIDEIKETRDGLIQLLEWKNFITEKITIIENKKHICDKEPEIYNLNRTIYSINKWKWYILGIFFAACSSLISFSIVITSNSSENRSYILNSKEDIIEINKKLNYFDKRIHNNELKLNRIEE